MFEILLLLNTSVSLFMTGVIWFVQVVHYPGFLRMNLDDFASYHGFHILSTGYLVFPPMLVELVTSAWLVFGFASFWELNVAGLAIVLLIWITTAMLQARYHAQLRVKASPVIVQRLKSTNWIRTILWTVKSVIGLYMLIHTFS